MFYKIDSYDIFFIFFNGARWGSIFSMCGMLWASVKVLRKSVQLIWVLVCNYVDSLKLTYKAKHLKATFSSYYWANWSKITI